MDREIFRWINGGPEWLAPGMRFFSVGLEKTPMQLLLVAIVVVLLAAGPRTRRAAILALVAFPIADGITLLIKLAYFGVRPCNDPGIVTILRIGAAESSGTASAHAANMTAVAVIFMAKLRGFGVPWALLAFLVGYSRVYNGVHYPYQVLLGWIVGLVVGFATLWIAGRIEAAWIARKEKRDETRKRAARPDAAQSAA